MKKVLIALVVLLFAVSVYAESRLDLSGQLRVRGRSYDNFGDWGASNGFNDDTDTDERDYFDQRLRIYGNINVSEDVTVHLRFDFAEETWGTQGTHSNDGDIDQDRAYIEIDKDMYNFKAGRQYFGLGNSIAVDSNDVGFQATLKLPVAVTLGYVKASEGGSTADEDENGDDLKDTNMYLANLGYKAEIANFNLFGAYADVGESVSDDYSLNRGIDYNGVDLSFKDGDQTLIGLQATAKLGIVNINAEYNYFTGTLNEGIVNGSSTGDLDIVGNQFYVDGNANLGMVKVGAELFYAMGTDEEDEIQTPMMLPSYVQKWDGFLPMGGFADSDIMDVAFGYQSAWMLAPNAGSMGAVPYVEFSPIDKLTLGANVGYFEPQEDSVTNLNSVMVAVLTADYKLYDNVGIKGQYAYASPDVDSPDANGPQDFYDAGEKTDDNAQGFFGKLYVNF